MQKFSSFKSLTNSTKCTRTRADSKPKPDAPWAAAWRTIQWISATQETPNRRALSNLKPMDEIAGATITP